jgi:hypothetical protein
MPVAIPSRRIGDMMLRIVAAIPFGYATASLWAMAMARLLPGSRSEATIIATLGAFLLCPAFAMWAFAARSGWRAVWTLALAAALAGGIAYASVAATGRS